MICRVDPPESYPHTRNIVETLRSGEVFAEILRDHEHGLNTILLKYNGVIMGCFPKSEINRSEEKTRVKVTSHISFVCGLFDPCPPFIYEENFGGVSA